MTIDHDAPPYDHGDEIAAAAGFGPKPLLPHRTPAQFPTDALPPRIRQYVEELSHATQTPADMAGLGALASISTLAAGRVWVQPRTGWVEPVNIYAVPVMPPASRKSAIVAAVTAPISDMEVRLREAAASDIAAAQAEKRILEKKAAAAEMDAVRGAKGNEVGLAVDAAKRAAEFKVPPMPQLFTDDTTPEAMSSLLAKHGRMAVISAEGGIFDIIAGRYSNGVPNMDVWLKGHAGDRVKVNRVGRDAEVIDSPAVTMFLTVQPHVLEGITGRGDFRGRGLLARILFAIPASNVGSRVIGADPVSVNCVNAYREALENVETLTNEALDSDSLTLRLDDEARAAFNKYEVEVERSLAPGGILAPIPEWGGKLAGAVARLAGLLHVAIADSRADDTIGLPTVEDAIRLGDYFQEHALHALTRGVVDEETANAIYLLKVIEEKFGQDVFSARDLHVKVQGDRRFAASETVRLALDVLVDHRQIASMEVVDTGRPGRKASPRYHRTQLTQLTEPHPSGHSVNSVNSVSGADR